MARAIFDGTDKLSRASVVVRGIATYIHSCFCFVLVVMTMMMPARSWWTSSAELFGLALVPRVHLFICSGEDRENEANRKQKKSVLVLNVACARCFFLRNKKKSW